MLLTHQHNQKQVADSTTFLWQSFAFSEGGRIIIITEIFATAFSISDGPIYFAVEMIRV